MTTRAARREDRTRSNWRRRGEILAGEQRKPSEEPTTRRLRTHRPAERDHTDTPLCLCLPPTLSLSVTLILSLLPLVWSIASRSHNGLLCGDEGGLSSVHSNTISLPIDIPSARQFLFLGPSRSNSLWSPSCGLSTAAPQAMGSK